jgi:nitrate reductase gamma subunit
MHPGSIAIGFAAGLIAGGGLVLLFNKRIIETRLKNIEAAITGRSQDLSRS